MKKMSRLFALVLALALALGCFQLTQAASDLPEVDLIYWLAGNPDMPDAEMVIPQLKAIAKDALNVNLDLQVISTFGEYKEKFTKAMAAQERVDLAWTGWVMNIQELANMGAVMPMDGYIEEYGQDLLAALDQRLIDAHRCADGKLYQYPNWQGMVGRRHFFIFPQNKIDATVGEAWVQEFQDVLYANWDKYTVEARRAPYDKLEEFLAALKENDMLGLGYWPALNSLKTWADDQAREGISGAFGYVDINDETFTVKAYFTSDWYREYVHLMGEWFDKGYIRSDAAAVADTVSTKEGWVGEDSDECNVMWGHNGFTEDISRELVDVVKPYYFVHTKPNCWTELGGATATIIPFTCAEPERAMMFLNWLVAGDEQATQWYNMYVFGIEGTHYAWNEDHDFVNVFETVGNGGAGSSTWTQVPWTLGSLRNCWSSENYPKEYYQELEALQETAYTSPMIGFSFDGSDVETEVALLKAAEKEYQNMINIGYLGAAGSDDKYNEFVDKLQASGLDDVIEVCQEQLTAFIEANNRTW